MDHWILSYKSPAEAWNEALPLGNGTLGVMSYGRLENETLELNLDTLWSGDGSSKLNKNGHADLGHLRKLLKDQKHPEAEDYCRKHILGDWTDSYLPAGRLNMSLQMSGQAPGGYVRQLSLNHAVETVASAGYKMELFVSMADPLLAVHFQAAPEQKLHLEISLESEIRYEKIKNCEDTVLLSGRAPFYVAPPYYDCPEPVVYEDRKGIRFTLAVKVVVPQGSVKCCDGKLLIEGEQDIFVYFTGNTDFGRNADTPQLEKECMEVLEDPDYEQLKKRHLGEYHKYFNRMELSLNDTRENRLAEMMFHYARYLMICSSRPGSQCANLQGIWNNRMRAPWSSNYTVNINTEMNYWMALPASLGTLLLYRRPRFPERQGISGDRGSRKVLSWIPVPIWGILCYRAFHFPGKPFLWRRWKTPQCGNGIHHGYQHSERTVRVLPENL